MLTNEQKKIWEEIKQDSPTYTEANFHVVVEHYKFNDKTAACFFQVGYWDEPFELDILQ